MLAAVALGRGAGLLAATTVLLAGCAVGPPVRGDRGSRAGTGYGIRSTSPAPDHTPVTVHGVVSCAVLPQQREPESTTADRLPSLRLPCLTPGPEIDLSALRGRPVLVNLWATWCGPCRKEMPLLQATSKRYRSKVQFVGVNTRDGTRAAAAFLADVGVTYPQVVDLDGKLLAHLRISGLPVTVLLDANGRIAGKHIGELKPKSIQDLVAKIA